VLCEADYVRCCIKYLSGTRRPDSRLLRSGQCYAAAFSRKSCFRAHRPDKYPLTFAVYLNNRLVSEESPLFLQILQRFHLQETGCLRCWRGA
jgi:hypothetical protein